MQAGKFTFRAAGIGFYIRGSAATEEALLLRFHAISLRFSFPAVWNSCYILSSRSFFVKNFFQDFFYRSDQSLSATFIEYHLSVSFVKYFFVLFQLFLMIFSVSLKDSLVIISCQNRYVNYFLWFFQFFLIFISFSLHTAFKVQKDRTFSLQKYGLLPY